MTLLVLTGSVIEAGQLGFGSAVVLCGFAVAAVAGTCFVVAEARGPDPMLPLHFFRQSAFSSAAAVGLLINLTLYRGIFVLGLYLQQVLRYSPMAAGFAFLPFPVALGLSNLAGRLGGRPRLGAPMAGGLLLGGLGFLLLGCLGTATSYAAMLPGLVVLPAGIGLAVPLMTSALLFDRPRIPFGRRRRRSQHPAAGRRRHRRGVVWCAAGGTGRARAADRICLIGHSAGRRCPDRRRRDEAT